MKMLFNTEIFLLLFISSFTDYGFSIASLLLWLLFVPNPIVSGQIFHIKLRKKLDSFVNF